MSSVGQAVGGIVGGAIGFFVGGPTGALYGAQAGMMVGGLLDPPKVKGPRLEDLSVQTSTYGAFVPRVYGAVAITGNIIWVQGDKLIEKESTSSGKGGPELTTYSYYATFAVALCEGPIAGVRRIWIAGQLWYDAGADDLDSVLASNKKAPLFTLYPGNDTQEADPLIQADKGIADTPAYRGIAYLVFDTLPLEKYGNSLMGAQVKVEIVTDVVAPTMDEMYSRVLADDVLTWSLPLVPDIERGFLITDFSGYNPYEVYSYYLAREITYPSGNPGPFNSEGWYPGISQDGRLVYFGPNWETFGIGGYVEAPLYSGFSTADTNWDASTLTLGGAGGYDRVVWLFFRKSDGPLVEVRVVYCPQEVFQEVRAAFSFAVNELKYAYDNAQGVVVIGLNGSFRRYDPWTGELIDTVSTSFAPLNGNRIVPESIDDGIFWDISSSTTYRTLRGFSLSSGALLHSFTWQPTGGGSTPALGYVVGNLFVYINDVWTYPNRFLKIYRLPMGSVDAQSVPLSSIVSAECLKSNILGAADIDVSSLTDDVRGYRVSQLGPLRGPIEQLRQVWPFDVRQHGYKIEFLRRGGSSAATIPAADLDAREAGQQPGVSITNAREMDLTLPKTVSVKYLDAVREYDLNEQSDERTSTDAVGHVELDIPVVLVADEAKQTATMLLYNAWLERQDISMVLPPTYQQLEPADIVTVAAENATYSLRLTSLSYLPDGRVECKTKPHDATVYSQASVADEGGSTAPPIALSGATEYVLLDIPLIHDVYDTPGFPVAIAGQRTGWPGGLLYASTDGGSTWTNPLHAASPGATIGQCANALGAYGSTTYDFSSVLSVSLAQGHTLASVTEAQLFSLQNWFAYGADGRWEIIAARTATLQGDGSYKLSYLLRGQLGTEWATGLHQAGDTIVLLNTDAIGFRSLNSSAIGVEMNYRGITVGETLDSDVNRPMTYTGVNLECLAPVNVGGYSNAALDFILSWTRQSRFAIWRDYVDTPLGEAAESYEMDVFSDNTFTTIKRTLTATSSTATYTAAQQITDFGTYQSTFYVKVYQISAMVGRGYAATATLMAGSAWPSTVALLIFEGADASTYIGDATGKHTWTAYGNAQIDTGIVNLSSTALLLDGNGDYVGTPDSNDSNFGTGDFTIEAVIRIGGASAVADSGSGSRHMAIVGTNAAMTGWQLFTIGDATNSNVGIGFESKLSGAYSSSSYSTTLTVGTWYHVAVSRVSGVLRTFIDGAKVKEVAFTADVQGGTGGMTVGAQVLAGYYRYFNGSMDNRLLRVTKGIGRYVNDFTPPSAPFGAE